MVLWPFLSCGFSIKYIHSFIHRNTPTGGGGGVLTIYAEQVSAQPTSAVNTWHAAGPCCRCSGSVSPVAGRSAENPPHAAAAADSWGTETDNSTLPEHQLLYYAHKVDLQRINVKWRAWL